VIPAGSLFQCTINPAPFQGVPAFFFGLAPFSLVKTPSSSHGFVVKMKKRNFASIFMASPV